MSSFGRAIAGYALAITQQKRCYDVQEACGVAIIRSDQLTPPQPKVKEGPLLATKQRCVFSVFTPVP